MKKIITATLMSASLVSSAAVYAVQEAALISVQEICARDAIECSRTDAGIVVGRPGTTNPYADGLNAAAKRFERFFGRTAPKAAVVLGEIEDADIRTSLLEAYPVVLPWLTIKDREAMVASGVRAQVRQQYPDMDEATFEAVVARSVQASLNASSGAGYEGGGAAADVHQGVYAHELGHLFFIRTFWPEENMNVVNTRPEDVMRYAGPGPDWLDEMAAVLMENQALTEGRETGLITLANEDDFSGLWPLNDYFGMTHPAFEQARAIIEARQNTAEGRAKGNVVILQRGQLDTRADGRDSAMFYSQSRGFADYLIEKTGNEQIFTDIATHIAAGASMESWLREFGVGYGLQVSVQALEADFHHWLEGRYGGMSDPSHGHS